MLVQGSDGTWHAWSAVEISSAVDLTSPVDFARLTVAERLQRAVAAQTVYAQRFHALGVHESVSLRWLTDGRGRLRVVVVGRSAAADAVSARSRAEALTQRLLDLPDHVVGRPLEDEAAVREVLMPFAPHREGLAQVRKRIRYGTPNRSDAGVAQYLAVEPFAQLAADWTPLLETLVGLPAPTMVAVQVAALEVPEDLRRSLEYEATRYAHLSRPTELTGELGARIRLPADQSAAVIARFYEDTLKRLSGRVLRFNVVVASAQPLHHVVMEGIAAVVSPVQPAGAGQPEPLSTGCEVAPAGTPADFALLEMSLQAGDPQDPADPRLDAVLTHDPTPARRPLAQLRSLLMANETIQVLRLPAAIEGHVPGLSVTAPGDKTQVINGPAGPSIVLGYQGVPGTGTAVAVPTADLARHAFIVGTPGSGKTNSALHLCEQLWRQKVPFMVLEPVNSELDDYRWLATRPGFEDLLVFTVGNEDVAPFRLNPFELPAGVTVNAHVSNLLACFEAAFGLWDPLPFVYRRALMTTYRRRGLYHDFRRPAVGAAPEWPVLQDFVDCLGEAVDALGYAGEIGSNIEAASKLRAQSLVEGACGPSLDCRTGFDLADLTRRPVIVELAGVGDNAKEQALVSLLLINAVRAQRRAAARGPDSSQHVLLVEEAHRIFPRATAQSAGNAQEGNAQALAAERIAQGLAEDRKYGQGYVLVDQQVGKVGEDAYKITNLKVMHRTSAEEDRKLLGATMAVHADQLDVAATLRPFQALVSHNALDKAVSVTVPDIRRQDAHARGLAEAPLAGDDELRRRHVLLLTRPEFAEAMAPYAECASCRYRCAFRRQADAVAGDLADDNLAEAFRAGLPDDVADDLAVSAGQPQSGPGTPDAIADYLACVGLHAFRRLFPQSAWTPGDRENALTWTTAIRDRLAEPAAAEERDLPASATPV